MVEVTPYAYYNCNHKAGAQLYLGIKMGEIKLIKNSLLGKTRDQGIAIIMAKIENSGEETSLHAAASTGNLNIAKGLLNVVPGLCKAIFIMMKNRDGLTALHYAAINGDIEMSELLINALFEDYRPAFIMSRNKYKLTAIDYANISGNLGLVEILNAYCSGVSAEDVYPPQKRYRRE